MSKVSVQKNVIVIIVAGGEVPHRDHMRQNPSWSIENRRREDKEVETFFGFHLVPVFLIIHIILSLLYRAQISVKVSEQRANVIKWSEYYELYVQAYKENSKRYSAATLTCLSSASSLLPCCIMAGWCKLVNTNEKAAAHTQGHYFGEACPTVSTLLYYSPCPHPETSANICPCLAVLNLVRQPRVE